ncbi:MAG: ABC transporter substrate-binding protein [Acidimicrobiia bacterium]|nr:ABC transporter substrate-binding protein [Acidimicrobiia bacterium]
MTSVRERIAIVFMTVSVIATLALGGAVIHELNRKPTTVAANGTSAAATSPEAGAAADQSASGQAAAGTAGSAGAAGSAGQTVSHGGSAGSAAPAGQLSNTAVASGGVITVGGVYDETGPFDATVERDTVKAYFNKVNDAGGVNGHKLQLLDCDSGYDPSRAHQCTQRLLSQGVLAMVGPLSVSGEEPETQFLNSQGVPMIGGLGVPSEFNVPLSWQVTASLTRYGTAMGTHAKDLGIKAPEVLIINANFIAPVKDAILAGLHAQGIKEKGVDIVDATKPDYTDIALKTSSEGADSIIAGLDPFSYARLFQALDRQNFHPKLLGLGLDKASANKSYGAAANNAESLTPLLEPWDHHNDPGVADYEGTVRKYFPNQVAALDVYSEGDWVAAELFVEAVKRIGNAPVTRQSLATALNAVSNFNSGLTVPLSYGAGPHDPNHCFQWIKNQGGNWSTYSGWNCF